MKNMNMLTRYYLISIVKIYEEYLILYQKRDVLILADVFEKFLNLCLRHYEIVPAFLN